MTDNPNAISSWISFMSNKVKSGGGINLAQGLPGFRPPARLLELLAEEAAGNNHQYAPGRGLPVLAAHVADKLNLPGTAVAKNILITCGATEAITDTYLHLARKAGSTFTVAAFGPAYESYSRLPMLLGHRFVELTRDESDPDFLTKTADLLVGQGVDLLFVGSPGNPFGQVIPANEVDFWCQMAAKTSLNVVFDMVYSDLWFDQPVAFPTPVLQERVYIVGSFSKMLSVTGWRVGWLAAPETSITEIGLLHDFAGLSAPHPLQWALSRFLDDKEAVNKYVSGLRDLIRDSCLTLEGALVQTGFHVEPAHGGYFVWAKLPQHLPNSGEFVLALYERTGVAAVPGIHFGEKFSRYVRFNGARPINEINEAAALITRFINDSR